MCLQKDQPHLSISFHLCELRPALGAAESTTGQKSEHCRHRLCCLYSEKWTSETICSCLGEWWDLCSHPADTQKLERTLPEICTCAFWNSTDIGKVCSSLQFFFNPSSMSSFLQIHPQPTATCEEGGLLLDITANHFFFFCRRKGHWAEVLSGWNSSFAEKGMCWQAFHSVEMFSWLKFVEQTFNYNMSYVCSNMDCFTYSFAKV